MEVAMEVEDDVFFADLSKQISLLIMDDDEDLVINQSPPVYFEGFSQQIYGAPRLQLLHEQQGYRRESKGTGVFIPRSSNPRRKTKQERYNSNNISKSNNRQMNNSARGYLPHGSTNQQTILK